MSQIFDLSGTLKNVWWLVWKGSRDVYVETLRPNVTLVNTLLKPNVTSSVVTVSWFTRYYCACTPKLYISELCEDCAVANEIDYEIDDAWTNIHGIHNNGHEMTSDFNSVL